MTTRLMRPSALFFPVAALLAAVLGHAQQVVGLILYYYLAQLCSLCAVDAFRNAAARESGPRGLRRRLGAALMPLLFSFVLLAALSHALLAETLPFPAFFFPLGAALCLLLEQLLEEYLFAWGRKLDGFLCALLSAALLMSGLMLDGSGALRAPFAYFYTLITAAIGALVALIVTLCHVRRRGKFSLVPRSLGFAPAAMLATLTYPLAAAALYALDFLTLPAALSGLILWRLMRTVCRRSQSETLLPAFLLGLVTALSVLLAAFFVPARPYASALTLADLLIAAVFLAPSPRLCASLAALCLAVALLYFPTLIGMPYIAVLLALIGAALNFSRRLLLRRVR